MTVCMSVCNTLSYFTLHVAKHSFSALDFISSSSCSLQRVMCYCLYLLCPNVVVSDVPGDGNGGFHGYVGWFVVPRGSVSNGRTFGHGTNARRVTASHHWLRRPTSSYVGESLSVPLYFQMCSDGRLPNASFHLGSAVKSGEIWPEDRSTTPPETLLLSDSASGRRLRHTLTSSSRFAVFANWKETRQRNRRWSSRSIHSDGRKIIRSSHLNSLQSNSSGNRLQSLRLLTSGRSASWRYWFRTTSKDCMLRSCSLCICLQFG